MQRRQFLAASLAASAAAYAREANAQPAAAATREFYLLRRYQLQSGPQTKLTESYFSEALIPALTRLGMGPIGAFQLTFGSETPIYYSLIPGPSVESLATVDFRLAKDEAFLKAAEPFWSAPAAAPAFIRIESSLMAAFDGWPRLVPPPTPAKPKRIFQLRTYESPSNGAHVRKVEMFNNGEFEIFKNAGCNPVFFSDTLIGPRTPSLIYMLSFADMEALNTGWNAFSADLAWKKLSTSPRYNYEPIVSSISNLILSPLSASQI
jgi:hypothetical protein